MEIKTFEQSSYLTQVKRLRKLAEEALKLYPLNVKSIDFIQHGENSTFKVVDSKENKYLLRIHRNGYHTQEAILEELKWTESVSKSTNLMVPIPLRAKSHQLLETVFLPEVGSKRYVCIFHWIDGHNVWKSLSQKHLYLLGQKMGFLQKQSVKRKVKHRRYWDAEGLLGENPKMGPTKNLLVATKIQQKIVSESSEQTFQEISNYEKKNPNKLGLIHADMHLGNVIFTKEDMGIIDFDDCGFGAHMYDIVIPLIMSEFVLKERKELKQMPKYTEAMLNGYTEAMSINQADLDILKWYTKARGIAMLGWVQSRSENPMIKARFKRILTKFVKKLQKDKWSF